MFIKTQFVKIISEDLKKLKKNIMENASYNRLRPLDSLRGIAAVGVAFFWHYKHFDYAFFENNFAALPLYSVFNWFYLYGWNLVDFFFVLSGFIFMHVYSKNIMEDKISERTFFILRLSRLYPLHVITLFTVAFLQYFRYFTGMGFFQCEINDLYHFILNLLFIQGGFFEIGLSFNGPSWSLSCEIIAYILFFSVLKKIKNPLPVFVLFVFIGLSILQMQVNVPLFNISNAKMLVGFFIGCLTFVLNLHILKMKSRSKNLLFGTILLLTIIIGLMIYKAGFTKIFGQWDRVMPILVYPLLIVSALNVFLLNRFLSLKPLTYMGDLSYSIYLIHFPVQLMMVTFLPKIGLVPDYRSWTGLAIFMVTTIAFASLSYHRVEKPMQNYIRKRFLTAKAE
jgi:peptidoglycan/LPS O-acetylase OafA/YrhL